MTINAGVQSSRQLHRILDTVGDGTGSTDGAVDASITPVIFKLAPAADEVFELASFNVLIADTAAFDGDDYGGINGGVTNGVNVAIHDGIGLVYNLLPVDPTSNVGWVALSESSSFNEFTGAAGDDFLIARILFGLRSGNQLRLDGSLGRFLQVTLKDDFTPLSSHFFDARGWQPTTVD